MKIDLENGSKFDRLLFFQKLIKRKREKEDQKQKKKEKTNCRIEKKNLS